VNIVVSKIKQLLPISESKIINSATISTYP
jgi:hypothetical protein